MEGLFSTGPTPSSFFFNRQHLFQTYFMLHLVRHAAAFQLRLRTIRYIFKYKLRTVMMIRLLMNSLDAVFCIIYLALTQILVATLTFVKFGHQNLLYILYCIFYISNHGCLDI